MSSGAARIALATQIAHCELCGLSKIRRGAFSLSGDAPNWIAVVGEAPTKEEDDSRAPWSGRGARYLRARINEYAGGRVAPDTSFTDTFTWIYACCCFANRTPLTKEVESCSSNKLSQLKLVQPRYVLLVGGVAVQSFSPKWTMRGLRGQWWENHELSSHHSSWFFATHSPDTVLRQGLNGRLDEEFKADLRRWVAYVSRPNITPPMRVQGPND